MQMWRISKKQGVFKLEMALLPIMPNRIVNREKKARSGTEL
jgi:hypothetical protein